MSNRNTGRTTRRLLQCLQEQVYSGKTVHYFCHSVDSAHTTAQKYAVILRTLGIEVTPKPVDGGYVTEYEYRHDGLKTGRWVRAYFLSARRILGAEANIIIGDIDDEI